MILGETTPFRLFGLKRGVSSMMPPIGTNGGNLFTMNLANRAHFFPIMLPHPVTAQAMRWVNGGTIANYLDFGVYLPNGSRVCSTGQVSPAATSTLERAVFTSTPVIGPGVFYLGVSHSGTTNIIYAWTPFSVAAVARLVGAQIATSAYPLPATVTFAANTVTSIPSLYMEGTPA